MIGYKNELERLQREKKDLTQSINDNKIKKENEIMEAQRLIEEKYDGLIQKDDRNLCETKSAIDFLKKKIAECSEFNGECARTLISMIIDIIKVYEGKNYIQQTLIYSLDSKRPIKTQRANVIISKNRKLDKDKSESQLSKINIRIKEGNALVLNWNDSFSDSKYIKFYDLKDNNIKHNVSFGKFNYIKEFVDYIISYRLENGLKEITTKEIEKLEIMFLRDNLYEIREYHEYLAEKEKEVAIEQAQENANHREKFFLRRIDKKLK